MRYSTYYSGVLAVRVQRMQMYLGLAAVCGISLICIWLSRSVHPEVVAFLIGLIGVLGFGVRKMFPLHKKPAKFDCSHNTVIWGPVDFEYQSDGTATVWQEGVCSDCRAVLQITYIQGEKNIVVQPPASGEGSCP